MTACGTDSAYQRHMRRNEPVDDLCREAHNEAATRRRLNRAEARGEVVAVGRVDPSDAIDLIGEVLHGLY